MNTGVLERIRGFEADIERSIDSMVQQQLFSADVSNERHRILLEHFKIQQVAAIKNISEKLLDAYLDEDDIVDAQEAPSEGQDVLNAALKEFDGKIADAREYHQTYRDLPAVRNELIQPDPEKVLERLFSVRERYGSCLDLEAHYNRYSSFMVSTSSMISEKRFSGDLAENVARWGSSWPGRLEYFLFVPEMPNIVLNSVDATRKLVGFSYYREFVEHLLAYLVDFHRRLHPLSADVPRLLTETDNDCEEFWATLVKEKKNVTVVASTGSSPHGVKVSCAVVVPPPLRKYLKSFSMWPLDIAEELVAQSNTTAEGGENQQLPRSMDEVKEVCKTEAKIAALLQSLLFDALKQTEKTLLRDYSKTPEELELDRMRAENEFRESLEKVLKSSSNTVEGTVAHTAQAHLQQDFLKNNAAAAAAAAASSTAEDNGDGFGVGDFIGDDGRPIARWLVQLQQLDKNFVCEVCGGTVYKGPKVFREHFGAERHAEGLSRLGITQSLKDYEGIASIRMAIAMRDRLANNTGFHRRLRDDKEMEEIQDGHGKVLTNKDYMRFQKHRTQ